MINWNECRNHDGTIDLQKAFRAFCEARSVEMGRNQRLAAENFLDRIEGLQPIGSRQAAAVAIAQAMHVAGV